jgi:DNA sulfur modification protein DndD
MKILRLKLKNFMAYKGIHEIDFTVSDSAPLILFLGENGHGKTTIQRASKWCLYGEVVDKRENIPAANLVNRKAVGSAAGQTVETSVEMEWEDAGNTYNLNRSFAFQNGVAQTPKAVLRKNKQNPEPEKAIKSIVNRILPKEISHFFFFDGETQEEFDRMTSTSASASFIKAQIEATLSIPAIKAAAISLDNLKVEESLSIEKANKQNDKVSAMTQRLNQARLERETFVRLKGEESEKLAHLAAQIDAIESQFLNVQETQDVMSEIHATRGVIEAQESTYAQKRDEIADLFGRYPWLPISQRIESTKADLERSIELQQDAKVEQNALVANSRLLKRALEEKRCPLCAGTTIHSEQVAKNLAEIEHRISTIVTNAGIADADQQLKWISELGFTHLIVERARDLKKEIDQYGSEISVAKQSLRDLNARMQSYGTVDVQDLLASHKALNADRHQAQQAIADYEDKERVHRAEIDKLQNAIGKVLPQTERYAYEAFAYLSSLFHGGLKDYTTAVRQTVEDYASNAFLQIISDKKYKGLRITENFGVELLLDGGVVDALRSTGQGKVSTISLISGLIRTAMDDGFILMDTPFVSLDMGHRAAVCKWATESGLRVSLFMHSGEFVWDRDRAQFGNHIGRVYTIKKIDDDETSIKEGPQ